MALLNELGCYSLNLKYIMEVYGPVQHLKSTALKSYTSEYIITVSWYMVALTERTMQKNVVIQSSLGCLTDSTLQVAVKESSEHRRENKSMEACVDTFLIPCGKKPDK